MDIRICKKCGFILGTRPNSKDYCNYYYNEQYLADLTLRHFSQALFCEIIKNIIRNSRIQCRNSRIFLLASQLDKSSPVCQFRAWYEKGGKPLKPLFLGNSRIPQNFFREFQNLSMAFQNFSLGILEFLRIFMSVQPFFSLALISSLIALVFISSRQRLFLLPLQPSQIQGTHSQLA